MSAATSRKFEWVGKTDTLRELSDAARMRVLQDITSAESEEAFTDETKRVIAEAAQWVEDREAERNEVLQSFGR